MATTQQRKVKALTRAEHAKAIAHFVCRYLIEDIHAEFKIPDKRMAEINRIAVDRAALYLDCAENSDDDKLFAFIQAQQFYTTQWDDPKETEDTTAQAGAIDYLYKEIKRSFFSEYENLQHLSISELQNLCRKHKVVYALGNDRAMMIYHITEAMKAGK